jgi:hypothetical protein
MGTATKDLRNGIDDALNDLEQVADEVRVKLHLAGMDMTDAWEKQLEPRLVEARQHARDATMASKAAIEDTVQAFREFARAI